ncbi:helix-turn-helix domain-containing protein [Flavobacterium branchiicola]|uniref:Helix-turn-helix domain-containing protein n=1 Tax=Flavobacterium branchiicola TaxID=1114875 RepID=A0ABV9PDW8_9FLAO|nr:helix-turn-helix transcriptional regulator [Flavobacterium branchiicola]MBS7254943.1 helix-turn-helix transcriptional regulator [Flavobacterium branchiicola]
MKQEKLKNIRKEKGLSQVEMAQMVAMEQTTYSRKEIGKSPIKDHEWLKFAEVLKVSVKEIKEVNTTLRENNPVLVEITKLKKSFNSCQNAFDIAVKYNKILETENEILKREILDLKHQFKRK